MAPLGSPGFCGVHRGTPAPQTLPAHENLALAYSWAATPNRSAAPPPLPLGKNSPSTPLASRSAQRGSSSAAPEPCATVFSAHRYSRAGASRFARRVFLLEQSRDQSKIRWAPLQSLCTHAQQSKVAAERLRRRRDPKGRPAAPRAPHLEKPSYSYTTHPIPKTNT